MNKDKITVSKVNAALKAAGYAERLRRGRGYYYFADGEAAGWPETSVFVNRVEALSIDRWIQERNYLKNLS